MNRYILIFFLLIGFKTQAQSESLNLLNNLDGQLHISPSSATYQVSNLKSIGIYNFHADIHKDMSIIVASGAFGKKVINVYETSTESWYLVNIDEYKRNGLVLNPVDAPRKDELTYIYTAYMSFYRSLPNFELVVDSYGKHHLSAKYLRRNSSEQKKLDDFMNRFKNFPIAQDAFVKAGLKYVKKIKLIRDVGTNFSGSPSQYSISDNMIYINIDDFYKTGFVVVLHELIQAGLVNARSKNFISKAEYNYLIDLNKSHFGNYNGYVGGKIDDNLVKGKAFAIGYTYRKIKTSYSTLGRGQKVQADNFIRDVNSNIKISSLRAGTIGTFDLRMIDEGSRSKIRTQRFVDLFMNTNGNLNQEIQRIRKKIKARL